MLFEASQNIFLDNLQIADIPRKSNGTYLIFIRFDNPQGMISKKITPVTQVCQIEVECVQTRIQVQAYLAYFRPPPPPRRPPPPPPLKD